MLDLIADEKLPKISHELPLTPMIDIVFLLIIFFVCIQFKRISGELEARLPKTPGVVRRLQLEDEFLEDRIRVNVRPPEDWQQRIIRNLKTGTEEVDGELQDVIIAVSGRVVSGFDELQFELAARRLDLEARGDSPLVILELDRRLTFQNVISTINATKKARCTRIAFTPPAGIGTR